MSPARSRIYEVRLTFHAPVDFAYRWCTDYRPDDARLEGEKYTRRVLERSKTRVVYEDLERTKHGWMWSHASVRLFPPDHWHADVVGNYRSWTLDYRLRSLGEGGTAFHMRGKRIPSGIGGPNPPKVEFEAQLASMWGNFGRALEADYRRRRPGRSDRRQRHA
ncbi:MAG: hypothetical protein ACREBT_02660 [Thermoplasmata archaeon]